MNTDRDFLVSLDDQIEKQDRELGKLLKEKQGLEAKISELQQWLERAKGLRDLESRRTGIAFGAKYTPVSEHRFFGMTPRDAYRIVLREKARASKPELVEAMKQGGFDFGGKNPRRVVHFALMGDPNVRKVDDKYELIENRREGAKESKLFRFT